MHDLYELHELKQKQQNIFNELMTGRSLRATPEGIQKLRKAIRLNDWKQRELQDELGLRTRQPITRLLAGEPIERSTFEELCHLLGLAVEEIAAPVSDSTDSEIDITALVQQIRQQIQPLIQETCGTMRVLDMTQPIELEGERGIYTNVNILEKLTGRRRLEISELLRNSDSIEFDRFGLNRITEKRVPGLDAVEHYSKLMVLGKPGAGKTTFLKYLAMQCISGRFLTEHVPIFVTLKRFAETKGEPNLLEYVCDDLLQTNLDVLQHLIDAGKIFFLLDGLDEVREEDTARVLNQIQDVSDRFTHNQFVITCRIAAKDYTFHSFAEVEVADFDDEQIQIFAQNWFRVRGDADRAELFVKKLKENAPIGELATSPLLLTLLCLMFEDTTSFPANRSELYKEGLDILLKKWDGKRKIERQQVYKNLSLKRKENLLSQIALTTFENKEYFFKQRTLEDYITDFIRNLPDSKTDPEALHLDSEAVLKSIEAHHGLVVERAKGIYSFSHLTFHEYFVAREIIESRNPESLQKLVNHITESHWREVFLLTAGMMRNADELVRLTKMRIDELFKQDYKLQSFLGFVNRRAIAAKFTPLFKIRRFYYSIAHQIVINTDLEDSIDWSLGQLEEELESDKNRHELGHELEGAQDWYELGDFGYGMGYTDHDFDDVLDFICELAEEYACEDGFLNDYFEFDDNMRDFLHSMALELGKGMICGRALVFALDNVVELISQFAFSNIDVRSTFYEFFDAQFFGISWNCSHEISNLLETLQNHIFENQENLHGWWQSSNKIWIEQFRRVLVDSQNISYDWQFTVEQKAKLQQYYDANKLLMDCLNSDCYINRKVREEIEETLLLPMSEIEK